MIFTILILFLREDTNETFYISRMVYETFDDDFNNINSDDSIYTFMRDKVGVKLLEQEIDGNPTLPHLRELSYAIGPIRIIQMRTKSKNCKKVFKDEVDSCYYNKYNDDSKQTTDICSNYEWCTFKNEKATGIYNLN